MTDTDAELARIAAALSILPPDEFVAARGAAAKATDDTSLAAAVKKLRKPVLAAWVVNLFAAEASDTLTPALRLADELRDAVDAGDSAALTALTRERRRTLRELTRAALDLAGSRGVDVSAAARDAVERTLDAALRDPDAAAAVASARLLRPIEATGMESPDLTDAVSGPYEPELAAPAPPSDELAERRERRAAERAARDAERHAQVAEKELDRIEQRWEEAQDRVTALDDRITELDAERDRLVADLDAARDAVDQLSAARKDARDEARAARKASERLHRSD
ncbi:hypothetical protein AB3M83_13215 [Microbacterium sp. 179-B 1A2 NHS]|uniref:hypothetical protein n=1 Tax=Microbacterium sp. 179-B 1A2 NHS TaxID=3142383 RepID=UPI0039A1FDBA